MIIDYLCEQKLKFGNGIDAFDPRLGILKGGPYNLPDQNSNEFRIINCGLIGSSFSIAKIKIFIEKISLGLKANNTTYGNYGFPGLGKNSPFRCSIKLLKEWEAKIWDEELANLAKIDEKFNRKEYLIEIIESKIKKLKNVDPPPEILLISIPHEIIDLFQREDVISDDIRFANRTKPSTVHESEGDIDFHSIVKIIGMENDIITQLIKPKTLDFQADEDEVTVAWNFVISLYYKDKGIPWKFSEFDSNVCYVGISFYRDFNQFDVSLNTSMAQVFLSTGDSYILRGDSFKWDPQKKNMEPRLEKAHATSIINKVLKFYYNQKDNQYPARLVIYKTSNFTDEEINGFYNNYSHLKNIDMITIQRDPKIKLYRQTKYPMMRGSVLFSDDRKYAILYTTGHISFFKTYPGMRVPKPIEVRKFRGNSDIKLICEEILTLSRLDWNSIKFCQRLPVTISFPQKVGVILAERRASLIQIKAHYRYYM